MQVTIFYLPYAAEMEYKNSILQVLESGYRNMSNIANSSIGCLDQCNCLLQKSQFLYKNICEPIIMNNMRQNKSFVLPENIMQELNKECPGSCFACGW